MRYPASDDGDISLEKRDGVINIRYPADCGSSEFHSSYARVSQYLREQTTPFSLVHDFTQTKRLLSLSSSKEAALADGKAIAKLGCVERVAFVVNISPLMRAVIRAGLTLSPVRPAELFSCPERAHAWAGEGLDGSDETRIYASVAGGGELAPSLPLER